MTKVDTTMMAALALLRTLPDFEADRTCPLCRQGPGTPRHVIMACEAMRPLVDAIRDDVEAALVATTPLAHHVQCATTWRNEAATLEHGQRFGRIPEGAAERWPALCAWGWLVPMAEREAVFGCVGNGHSREGTEAERGEDLAYRAVLPRPLGRLLCVGDPITQREGETAPDQPDDGFASDEEFSTSRQPKDARAEASRMTARRAHYAPAVRVCHLLAFGLRRARAEYYRRVRAWAALIQCVQAKTQRMIRQRQNNRPKKHSAWKTGQCRRLGAPPW